jgi:hypothetical protein
MIVLSNGFGRFFKRQMLYGSNCLKPNIWRGLTSFLPTPRGAPNFGRGCIKLNISLNGGLLLRLVMVTIVFFGKIVGYMMSR